MVWSIKVGFLLLVLVSFIKAESEPIPSVDVLPIDPSGTNFLNTAKKPEILLPVPTKKPTLPLVETWNHYEILAPKIMRPGKFYKISFSTFTNKVRKFRLTMGVRNTKGEVLYERNYNLKSDRTHALGMKIPLKVPEAPYEIYLHTEGVPNINVTQPIKINRKLNSLFIQTDKGLYKPGQKVLFRVVSIMPNLQAYKDVVNVTIYDTAQNKIKELKDQKNDNGVITSELQLSSITSLGKWKIKAQTKYAVVEKFFTVAEYVLPKFEVTVDLPPFFYVNVNNQPLQEDLKATILAKYTFGKAVKGVANVVIQTKYGYWRPITSKPTIKKVLQLKNGKADISLTVKDLLSLLRPGSTLRSLSYQILTVQANVTETLTGNILGSEKDLPIKSTLFKLEYAPSTPDNYKPGLHYEAYLSLLKIDGTPPHMCDMRTSNGAVKVVHVEIKQDYSWRADKPSVEDKFDLELDEQGNVFIQFKPLKDIVSINIKASFFDQISLSTIYRYKYLNKFETRDMEAIKIDLLNEDKTIKPGTRLRFLVQTSTPIKKYSLSIIARGNIVYTKYASYRVGKTSFYPNLYMGTKFVPKIAPEARFVVSYATARGELIADSISLNVADYMINKMRISFNKNQTKPGESGLVLNVRTQKNSFVGLLGVDQSVLLLNKGNDLTSNLVSNELESYSNQNYNPGRPMPMFLRCFDCGFWPPWRGGKNTFALLDNAGLFVLTNLYVKKFKYQLFRENVVMDDVMMRPMTMAAEVVKDKTVSNVQPADSAKPLKVRTEFPETLLWVDTKSNHNGRTILNVTVPDTITSWVATGFSVSSTHGLGISEGPAKFTVIKPFFISLNLPYSIKRGEEFALQANVFNYMGRDIEAEVKLLASEYFQVISCKDKSLKSMEVKKDVEVKKNDATSVYFWVVATSLGHIPIEVRAFAGVAADAIKRTLLVEPEGQQQSYTTSELIQLKAGESFNSSFPIELPPKDLVEGSVVIEVTLIGDIMGSALNGIEDLLKMPYGCGEQNMLGFAPDVYILTYLQVSNQLTDAIKTKAVNFITSGYQRQLTYQRNDGSFSAFGQSDKSGSTWLSAFTIKCFHQAKDFIPIEDVKVAKTLKWVIKNQQKDGTFVEPVGGRVIHTNMQGGASSGIAMTAYVLISLIENKENPQVEQDILQESIRKATSFLEMKWTEYSKDAYALAIISYALFKAESEQLATIMEKLNKMAVTEGGLKHWKGKPEDKPSDTWRSHYGSPKSYDVELASYVLLTHSQNKDLSKALPIAKWLLTQRNAFGGFSSTQDTVLGLEALASFSALIAGSSEGEGIVVTVGNDFDQTIHTFDPITRSNSLFLQSVQLPSSVKEVTIKASNEGTALVQLIVKYNVDNGDNNDLLNLKLDTESNEKFLAVNVTTSWNGTEVSGMVVVEIAILTGYSVVQDEMIKLQIGDSFKKLEKSGYMLVIYLDELTKNDLSFSVMLQEELSISKVKPALVKVYRYYDSEYVASAFYSSSSVNTWQSSCPLCC